MNRCTALSLTGVFLFVFILACPAAEPPPPSLSITQRNGQIGLSFPPYPGADAYSFFSAPDLGTAFIADPTFTLAPYVVNFSTNGTNYAYEWQSSSAAPQRFYGMAVSPMDTNVLVSAIVLNRLAYGPTPDEWERVTAMGAQGYIDEQLTIEGVPETMDNYIVDITNSVPSDPSTNWTLIVVTGRFTGTNLYLFLTKPGEVYIDDIQLVEGTNAATGPNLLSNGDFETPLAPAWVASGTVSGSGPVSGAARSGSAALRLVSTAAGSTTANYLRQGFVTTLTNNAPVTLSYWYLQRTNSSLLRAQLTGSGLASSAGGLSETPRWVYGQSTGVAGSSPYLYIYLSSAGECYLDDLTLVSGPVANTGPNLLQNAGLENATVAPWLFAADFARSGPGTNTAHTGGKSLRLVATAAGSASTADSVYQSIPGLVNGQTYTLSYWYLPANPGVNLNLRLHGSLLQSAPDIDSTAALYRRITTQQAGIEELRAWFARHAVESRRQLLEVLSQFWENHFVTYYTKSRDYLSSFSYESGLRGRLAADWEARELLRWRNAMLNPQCTFYDLLRISAESPAMIVYLDTVNSRGDGTRIANENYARELLELFTFGVDNGYDQNDIIQMSRAWTGWSVDIVDAVDRDNPLAPLSATYYPNVNSTLKTNTVGTWSFVYRPANHGTNRGPIFAGRTVPARFGPPWSGRNYQLNLPPRTGNGGLQDGYDVIAHLANQPFTEEYISIKLCRLFVHEDFPNPTTDSTRPEYAFYDYTNPNRSAEAELIHACMLAWENGSPKGQIRPVLQAIFSSPLFQSHNAASQKVKTPFEYVASSIRALRSVGADGTATAFTDGYSFTIPLDRMGTMRLFDREAPDGYPEFGQAWISAGTLTERIRFIQALNTPVGTGRPTEAGNSTANPMALIKRKLPSANWNSADAVADYIVRSLYPAEGAANLALYRKAAVDFLNTADDGITLSPFANLGNTTAAYDLRVRGMVSMVMTFQRFHEQ